MSSAETTENTRNQMFTNYDSGVVFPRIEQTESGNFTNDTYDDVTLLGGTIMGRVSATGDLVPLASGATDGSQYPVGALMQPLIIEAGNEATITIVTEGEIDQNKIILDGSDTLQTVISGRQLRDRINGDTLGLKITYVDELSGYDNQ